MTWTPARTEHLRRRWAEGRKAREIAAELDVRPTAVLAKVWRLRLEGGPDAPAARGGTFARLQGGRL